MAAVQQITIHPREIPPRRKFDDIPKSPFKRPFDPPRRVGDFPLPDPPPFQVDLSKPKKIKKRDTDADQKTANSKYALKKAIQTYESDPEQIRARWQKSVSVRKTGPNAFASKDGSSTSRTAAGAYSLKAFQSAQQSLFPQQTSQLDLLA